MNKGSQAIAGIIIIVLIIGGMYFWYRTTIPALSEVESAAVKIEPINANILGSQTAQKISTMDTNGPIPVEVKPEDIGRDDPFSNF